ncbi:MAG: hypothetical protein JW829_10500, partial [Pirellulales bacterium]|nr:hypothetical protein [Pirellulales bacterium]
MNPNGNWFAFQTILVVFLLQTINHAMEPDSIVFENNLVKYVIGSDAHLVQLVDKRTGADHHDPEHKVPIAHIRINGSGISASSAEKSGNDIKLTFGNSGATATIRPIIHETYIVMELVAVHGEKADFLVFIDLVLKRDRKSTDPFVGCTLALNLKTNVHEIPQGHERMRAMGYQRFGFEGAQAALIACPQSQLRPIMQQAITEAPELPKSRVGGPWAADDPRTRGSYLFNFGDLTEQTVDAWIAVAKELGMNQIDFHGGRSFRFGDCRPNPEMYPNGLDSLKAVIDRLHDAGIMAGLHPYAFFIAKETPWVTPVPDPRLGKDATYTLAEDIPAEAKIVPVRESIEGRSTETGFFVRNSMTLQIDDELITYAGLSIDSPCGFTKCTRGAHGTRITAHQAGAKVHHLKQCFFLFCPDGDSTLLAEIAQKTADVYNYCGFDMMYLDALDGEGILGGNEYGWHYGSKFVFELFKRLEKQPVMEMSTFHHHLWYVRSRIGAWDHPNRSHKRFIDLHVEQNAAFADCFLPAHLGWWAVKTWHGFDSEPTYSDDLAYLCTKAIAHDVGISLIGIDPNTMKTVPAYQRLAKVIREHEALRHSGALDEAVKKRLAQPGKDYDLFQDGSGRWRFREVQTNRFMIGGSNRTESIRVVNPFHQQPAKMRVEVLHTISDDATAEGVPLIDFRDLARLGNPRTAEGVRMQIGLAPDPEKNESLKDIPCGKFVLNRRDATDRKASWAGTTVALEPRLDLSKHQGLGCWIWGDGSGALLNIQLRSPHHISN